MHCFIYIFCAGKFYHLNTAEHVQFILLSFLVSTVKPKHRFHSQCPNILCCTNAFLLPWLTACFVLIFDYTSNDLCYMLRWHRPPEWHKRIKFGDHITTHENPNLYPNAPIQLNPFVHIWFSFDTCSQSQSHPNTRMKFILLFMRRN